MLVLRWIMLVPAVQLLSTSDARGRAIRGRILFTDQPVS